jgi:hypothetical protein
MAGFPRLLQSSRVVSLYKAGANPTGAGKNKLFPVDQVVGTTSSSFHRGNWGLKSQIPSKHKSLYVNVKALDSESGLAQFDGNTGFYRRWQRFREFQVPLELPKRANADSYFKGSSKMFRSVDNFGPKEIGKLNISSVEKRQEFKDYLFNTKRASLDEFRRTSAATQEIVGSFLGLDVVPEYPGSSRFKSAVGLSYTLKGSLINTPQGIRTHIPVAGRVLDQERNTSGTVGLGGFVALGALSHSTASPGRPNRMDTHEFIINKASVNERGMVNLNVVSADAMRKPSKASSARITHVLGEQAKKRRFVI